MRYEEFTIEGRNAVIEALRSGKPMACRMALSRQLNEKPRSTMLW